MNLNIREIMELLGEKDIVIAELNKIIQGLQNELAKSATQSNQRDQSETGSCPCKTGRVKDERGTDDQQAD